MSEKTPLFIESELTKDQLQVLRVWRALFKIINAENNKDKLARLSEIAKNFGDVTKDTLDGPFSYDLADLVEDKLRQIQTPFIPEETPAYKNLWPNSQLT